MKFNYWYSIGDTFPILAQDLWISICDWFPRVRNLVCFEKIFQKQFPHE